MLTSAELQDEKNKLFAIQGSTLLTAHVSELLQTKPFRIMRCTIECTERNCYQFNIVMNAMWEIEHAKLSKIKYKPTFTWNAG